ncbi:hypothetical protein RKD30_006773 [Streptomyces pristinaespiralis]
MLCQEADARGERVGRLAARAEAKAGRAAPGGTLSSVHLLFHTGPMAGGGT